MNKNLLISSSAIFIYLIGTGFFYLILLKVLGSIGFGIFISLLSYGNFFGQLTTFGLDNQYLLTTLDSESNDIYIFISYFKKFFFPIIINIAIALTCGIIIFNFKAISSLFLVSIMVIYMPLSQLIQSQFVASDNTIFRILWYSSQPWIKSTGLIIVFIFFRKDVNDFDQLIINTKYQTGLSMGLIIFFTSLLVFYNIKNNSNKIKSKEASKKFETNNQNLYFGLDHVNFHAPFSLTIPFASLFISDLQTSSLALAYSIYSFPHLFFFIIWQQLFQKKITKLILNKRYINVISIINRIKKRVILPLILVIVISFLIIIPAILNFFKIDSPNFSNEIIFLSLSLLPSVYLIYQNTLINSISKVKIKSIYGIILNLIYFILLIFVARKYSSIGVAILHTLFIFSRSYLYEKIIYKNYISKNLI